MEAIMRALVLCLVLVSLSCARSQPEDEESLRVRDTAVTADTTNPSDTLDRARGTPSDSAARMDSIANP